MKLNANWIVETQAEICLICRQRKRGSFLIIYLSNIGGKYYLALCEECFQGEKTKQ